MTNAPAGLAAASGSAAISPPANLVPAGLALATGTAPFVPGDTVSLTLTAINPVGAAGTALAATVSGTGNTNAPAGLASAASTALAPAVSISMAAGLAAGTGAALNATASTTGSTNAPAGLATGTGTALGPSFPLAVTPLRRISGRVGVAYLSVIAGSAASPVAFLSGWDVNYTGNPIDVTVATDPQHVYTAGMITSAGTFTGFFDTATAQTYVAATDGQPRNLYLYPSTANPGQFFSGLVVADFALSGSVADAVKLAVNWSAAGLVAGTGL